MSLRIALERATKLALKPAWLESKDSISAYALKIRQCRLGRIWRFEDIHFDDIYIKNQRGLQYLDRIKYLCYQCQHIKNDIQKGSRSWNS